MSLFIASLNSGSNGNCYYIGNNSEAVLIDAGISCRETEKRMKRLGLPMSRVKAIFISHEHSDHIAGVRVLSKKFKLPVYITDHTLQYSGLELETTVSFRAAEPVTIGTLTIHAFTKYHDAGDPHSFMVSGNAVNIGIFTDIGRCCEQVTRYFKNCHAAFLEANYDRDMLFNGGYPYHLKKRISGGNGHLSNDEALQLFLQHRPAYMSHLLLAHLSKNNNTPEIVADLFRAHRGNTEVIVASRFEETAVFEVRNSNEPIPAPVPVYSQTSLF
ncbi:MBL fold metallo-hydrolase [Sediminibacterium ginsengisoli]|uniref:Phosphoribosyl 1,2-cyclic phosphodiesterase n=1 Tax=Sediminibacterium ginsengisoli TaxID=413434 RepID=A0A1T4PA95_9BACT|nr:MBL fold metallo-hydrolase [Sediminibacterium ginsengisoli]SJZ88463.1 Phosphoribosyl 1,2-cyclic phosphodiesterase [Sediminibacterium ginsengisoli]